MAISFDSALGNQVAGLQLRVKRSELLSNNIANTETPGYRAVDFDFAKVYDRTRATPSGAVAGAANPRHLSLGLGADGLVRSDDVEFRDSKFGSLDGNKVSMEQERARFMENQIRMNATNMFLSKRFSSLQKALRGVNG